MLSQEHPKKKKTDFNGEWLNIQILSTNNTCHFTFIHIYACNSIHCIRAFKTLPYTFPIIRTILVAISFQRQDLPGHVILTI